MTQEELIQQLEDTITACQKAEEDLKEAIDFIQNNKQTGDEQFKSKAWTHLALAIQSLEYKGKELKELFSSNIES